jgi:hypothetical protein
MYLQGPGSQVVTNYLGAGSRKNLITLPSAETPAVSFRVQTAWQKIQLMSLHG